MYFVRTASARDLDKIRALLIETFHATYDPLYGAEKVEGLIASLLSPAALKKRLEKKDSEFVVADDGKELGGIGYAALSDETAKLAVLHMLYVRPSAQRQGVGRDLFAELETCFPDADRMRMDVEPENAAAIAFAEGLGFDQVGRNDNAGPKQSGLPALMFERALASH
ncbi:GNAT family N-acetyltransferase [Rhizobium sp. HT1-10]|uniref:GNAT family N-acetyltransferase n=1 Tax=Rhizobium sp. HT1-10 TaxID=3111638 RepID=UPI003C142CED